jgi:hypothetical protein
LWGKVSKASPRQNKKVSNGRKVDVLQILSLEWLANACNLEAVFGAILLYCSLE